MRGRPFPLIRIRPNSSWFPPIQRHTLSVGCESWRRIPRPPGFPQNRSAHFPTATCRNNDPPWCSGSILGWAAFNTSADQRKFHAQQPWPSESSARHGPLEIKSYQMEQNAPPLGQQPALHPGRKDTHDRLVASSPPLDTHWEA